MGKVLHASYSGYFPSCIGGPRTSGVINGSLEKIMSLYWRVKTWQIESIVGNIGIFNFSQGQKDLGSISATTEEELVCGKTYNNGTLIYATTEEGQVGVDFGLTYQPVFSKMDENYQMSLLCSFFVAGNTLAATNIEGENIGNVQFQPVDISIPIYTGVEDGGSLSVIISAKEWWSYGGTYDTSTGQPL